MAIADIGLGAQLGLRDLLLQRVKAQQYADQLRQKEFENQRQLAGDQRADRQIDETSSLRRAMEADAATQKGSAEANALGEQIPPNAFLAETDPAVATMQKYGRGFLLTKQDARPAVTEGPLLPGDTGAAKPQGFLKTATQKQIDTNTDNARQQGQAGTQAAREAEQARHDRAMETNAANKPTATIAIQTVDADGNPVTRIVPKTAGDEFKRPPSSQEAQHAQAKHEALGSLDQLDQAIEAAKDLVGPGAGRVSSIQQMIGNPDPKISALGTKMLLAKMQVDHAASGTVRAGASPQILSRWDNILGNNQTPAGLKASVQAMREILGGQAATPAASATKPTAQELIQKYGGR